MKKTNKMIGSLCAVFNRNTTLYEVDQFVDKFRKETDKKDEFIIDLNLSKTGRGHKVFFAKHKHCCLTTNPELWSLKVFSFYLVKNTLKNFFYKLFSWRIKIKRFIHR